jgi:glycosyltransferase involved in cell wall biosynthesis
MRPGARPVTRVDLVGPRYVEDEREVTRRTLDGIVRFRDALPHGQAVALLPRARVLVLMEQESDRGALILPGKVFEYLRAGRPILALVPRGAAWDLVTRLGAGSCALPSDPRAAAAQIALLYDAYLSGGGWNPPVAPSRVAPFERRALTARLAGVLAEVEAETRKPRS